MISANFITEWAAEHPWWLNEQVEQDLLISRSLVAIYSDPFLKERYCLAQVAIFSASAIFRGYRPRSDITCAIRRNIRSSKEGA